jgi:tetratricopeptide (TPR) repeat protein
MKVNNNLGNIYLKKELYDQAIEYFTRALEAEEDDPFDPLQPGLGLYRDRPGDLAQTVLEQLIKLEPDYWDAYYRLGTVLISKGKWRKAKAT